MNDTSHPKSRMRWSVYLVSALIAACASSSSPGDDLEPGAELSGGRTTIFDITDNAYTFPAANLDDDARSIFSLGDHFFNRNWVTAPSSLTGNDGLGPTFNATSCSACHLRDGRGSPPSKPDEDFSGLLIRLSIPGKSEHGGPNPEPNYGDQFNPFAILGVPPEGRARVQYTELAGAYADGETFSLRRPEYVLDQLAFGPMAAGVMMSPRVAPPTFGLGLLQAVPEASLLALADEADANQDGISGRPNFAWNPKSQKREIGRFGWKANQPTIEAQTAGALLGDIGMTTSLFVAQNCPPAQSACAAAPAGGRPGEAEINSQKLDSMVAYGMTLAVPARRDVSVPQVRRGQALFDQARCSGCHTKKMTTGLLDGYPSLSNQTIRPYTDLLLHDMGEGLADGRPDFDATGNEWRTPPLWGLGLSKVVNGHENLLHDGRARGPAEAILWHGGEATASREAFRTMPRVDRDALLSFLKSM